MILHCVFCDFLPEVSGAARDALFEELSNLSLSLEGVETFEFGPNRDFEQKSQNFSAGFVIRFRDQAALEAYAVHPGHQALGAQLCDMCTGGADGIVVFDLEI